MKLIRDIREFISWRKERRRFRRAISSLYALELAAYSSPQCLLCAADFSKRPMSHEEIGPLAITLYARSGRGKTTLQYAIDRYIDVRDDRWCE